MLQAIVQTVIESGPQVLGWAVLKGVTLGRYRGFQPEDILFEGTVGLATLIGIGCGVYLWWPS